MGQMTLARQPPLGQLLTGRMYLRYTGAVVATVTLQGHLAAGAGQMVIAGLPRRTCWFVPAGSPPLTSDLLPAGTRATVMLRQSAPPQLSAGQLFFEVLPTARLVTLQFYAGVAVIGCLFS